MNERIRELHNRACRLDMDQYPNAIPDGERIQQKFAELLIKECADRIVNTLLADLEGPDPDDVLWLAAKQVKEHFGVEE